MKPLRKLAIGLVAAGLLAADDGTIKKIPRFRFKLDVEGWTMIAVTGGIAAADHMTTQRIINAGGYETNSLIRNKDGTVNYKKATIFECASLGLTTVYYGVVRKHTPNWAHTYIIRPLFIGTSFVRLWNGPVHNVRLCNSSGRC